MLFISIFISFESIWLGPLHVTLSDGQQSSAAGTNFTSKPRQIEMSERGGGFRDLYYTPKSANYNWAHFWTSPEHESGEWILLFGGGIAATLPPPPPPTLRPTLDHPSLDLVILQFTTRCVLVSPPGETKVQPPGDFSSPCGQQT